MQLNPTLATETMPNRWTKRHLRLVLCAGFVLAFSTARWPWSVAYSQGNDSEPTAGQLRKNIQVIKDIPESKLFLAMNAVGNALGVHCDHCHVNAGKDPKTGEDRWVWESDDKTPKLKAREMMKTVVELNAAKFGGAQAVSCYTCHRGGLGVARSMPLPPRDFVAESLNIRRQALPSAGEVIARYVKAIGGHLATSRSDATILKGRVERSRGRTEAIELLIKGVDKYSIKTTSANGVTTQVANLSTGWIKTNERPRRLTSAVVADLRRSFAIYDTVKVPLSSESMRIEGIERVDSRDTYVLAIDEGRNVSIRYFFDVRTGYLVRRIVTTETMLAPLPEQTDFGDYRDVDGVKLPFRISTSTAAAFETATRRFANISRRVKVDAAMFEIEDRPE